MGRDSNPRCLSAHTLSRRAQSTTLSPIQNNLPLPLNLTLCSGKASRTETKRQRKRKSLQLQPPEQFVQWQLDADVKFAEIGVLGANRVKAHFVNDRFDLKRVARKERHAPFGIIEARRTRDELFYFSSKFPPDIGVSF